MVLPVSAFDWTTDHVRRWLVQQDFEHYTYLLCDVHLIDGTALLMLTEDDLKNPPLSIEVSPVPFKSKFSCFSVFPFGFMVRYWFYQLCYQTSFLIFFHKLLLFNV